MDHMFATLPLYLQFLGTSVALVALGLLAYVWATPHREFELIRAGNRAAALSFGGTVIGLAYAINSQSSSTMYVAELAAWGAVAVLIQIAIFFVVSRLLLRDFKAQIEKDNVAYGIVMGLISIAVGVLNAGALSS
jgi:putative membrane protein